MRAGDDALQVADADAAADRIVDPDDAVAELMQAARFFVGRAVGDVLAVEVLRDRATRRASGRRSRSTSRRRGGSRSPTAR